MSVKCTIVTLAMATSATWACMYLFSPRLSDRTYLATGMTEFLKGLSEKRLWIDTSSLECERYELVGAEVEASVAFGVSCRAISEGTKVYYAVALGRSGGVIHFSLDEVER